eukprot:scaffold29_cov251-Pinguiococcus_pyrenoidosus.AAC.60
MEIPGCATAPEAWPTIQLDDRWRDSSAREGACLPSQRDTDFRAFIGLRDRTALNVLRNPA